MNKTAQRWSLDLLACRGNGAKDPSNAWSASLLRGLTKRLYVAVLYILSIAAIGLVSYPAAASHIELGFVDVEGAADFSAHFLSDLTYTRSIFDQVPLDVHIANINSTDQFSSTLVTSDSNLLSLLNNSTYQLFPVITVWYFSEVKAPDGGTYRGYSWGDSLGRVGVAVADISTNDTLAHEIAHLLTGLGHDADPQNLLASGSIRLVPANFGDIYPYGAQLDQITTSQAALMLDSSFVTPEPSSLLLLVLGLALLIVPRTLLRRIGSQ